MGIKFAISSRFGNAPWLKNRLYHLNVLKIPFWIISRFWLEYHMDHLLCLFSLTLLGLQCPLIELGKGKLCYCFQGQRTISVIFLDLTMFLFIFSSTLVKKLLKYLEISLALVTISSSIRRLEIDLWDLFFKFIIPLMVCHTNLRFFFIMKIWLVVRIFCFSKQ